MKASSSVDGGVATSIKNASALCLDIAKSASFEELIASNESNVASQHGSPNLFPWDDEDSVSIADDNMLIPDDANILGDAILSDPTDFIDCNIPPHSCTNIRPVSIVRPPN
jgi:hypothetical protein